jgi:hypothetical protein
MAHHFDWEQVLVDDALLPSQFPQRPSEPACVALLRAIFASAIQDLRHPEHCPANQRGCRYCLRRLEAWRWIAGGSAPLSFIDICHGLDLDPLTVRRALRAAAAQRVVAHR